MLVYSLVVGLLCGIFRVRCIAMLTDVPVRKWRHSAILATSLSGHIYTLMPNELVSHLLPTSRTTGPMLLPISVSTSGKLSLIRSRRTFGSDILFAGYPYGARLKVFQEIGTRLDEKDIQYDYSKYSARAPVGSPNNSDDYWNELASASIVVTTGIQCPEKYSYGTDKYPHFIFRYFEVMLAGALLLSHKPPGSEQYFSPGIHYISYETGEEAADLLIDIARNPSCYHGVAIAGHKRARELAQQYPFWKSTITS